MAGEAFKSCPHCSASIPAYAIKCRECFADISRPPKAVTSRGMWGWVFLLLVMAGLGAATLLSVFGTEALAQVRIDEGTQSVELVWTRYNRPPTTRRIAFAEVAKVELVTDASTFSGTFWEVWVVTNGGERVLINRSAAEDLQGYAEDVVTRMRKPLIPINKVNIGTTVLQEGAQANPSAPR